jgi:tetratricopeptide (TPR) repeat protein
MDWQAEYAPRELRYAPVALAGVVTLAFHLPPLGVSVNRAAQPDYFSGLSLTRRDSTIDQALPLLERAVAADSDSPLTYAALAEAQWFKYYVTKDQAWLDRFTDSVREAEMREPDLPEVHRVAGLLKANSGLYELAATEYLRAIDLDPKNGDGYRRLGLVYESSNLLDKALDEYRLATERDPQQYRNQQALGAFYYQRARYTEAVPYLQKLVELAPLEPNAHYALGSVYMSLGQFAKAEHELDMSLGLGETPTALHHRASVLMFQRRDAEAIPYLLRGVSRWPDHFKLWMALGNAYRNTNRGSDSERAFRRALDEAGKELGHDPRNGNTRAFRSYLFARLGDSQNAGSEAVQAMQLSPEDVDTRWVVAETFDVVGKRDEALAVLRGSPAGLIADFGRWPEMAELCKDPRFVQLLASRQPR